MEKVREYFDDMCVKKGGVRDVFATLSIPSFIRDWFLKKYSDSNGEINTEFAQSQINKILPSKSNWNSLVDNLMTGGRAKFIAKLKVHLNIRTDSVLFSLPDFGIDASETSIPANVWAANKDKLLCGDGEIWGVVTLAKGYVQGKERREGRYILEDFHSFTPYRVDLEYYKFCRENFTLEEWIDMLLMAIDYNPSGFTDEEQKLTMLMRLLPFVEKRINLIELAPKGTGKSYIFSQISKKGWLVSGGVMTRAKMFYDMKNKTDGLVAYYDYIALDEIATIRFPDVAEMQGALKSYLESGTYNVGIKAGKADAGIILLGNISADRMDVNSNMFEFLPDIFNDSALVDRFHGFIEGWKIPRMNENLKAEGWALNSEYLAEIFHELRDDIAIKNVVDALLYVPKEADTRDTNAVKRIACGCAKLLFPLWDSVEKVDRMQFEKYCLQPAIRMRGIICKQLGIMDAEYSARTMAAYAVRSSEKK